MSIYLHSLSLVKCSRFKLRNEVVDYFISKPPTTTTLEASPLFTPTFTSQGPVMQPRHIRKSNQGVSGSFDTIFWEGAIRDYKLGIQKIDDNCHHPVDGSEILRSPVEVASLSHDLQGFIYIYIYPPCCLGFLNYQPYEYSQKSWFVWF